MSGVRSPNTAFIMASEACQPCHPVTPLISAHHFLSSHYCFNFEFYGQVIPTRPLSLSSGLIAVTLDVLLVVPLS